VMRVSLEALDWGLYRTSYIENKNYVYH
jgi:hypothetical protein